MTDHVARAIEREFINHLDPCDLYELKAKVEQFLRPTRDRIYSKRFPRPNDDPSLTPDEQRRLTEIAGGRKSAMGDSFK